MNNPSLQPIWYVRPHWRLALLAALVLFSGVPAVRGQDYFDGNNNAFLPRVLARPLEPGEQAPAPRPHRVRLLGINPGFLSDPPGIEQDELNPTNPGVPSTSLTETDAGMDWITVAVSNDNPYLEARRRGDPGGVGYYRLCTQLQVVDSPTTGCTLGFQVFTPAGFQYFGLQNGPTSFCPNFGVFHLLNPTGTALQTFLGNRVLLDNRLEGQFRRNIQYGVAVQQPLWTPPSNDLGTTYIFFEALGRYRDQVPSRPTPPAVWQFLPGVSWRGSSNVWLSSGVVLPIGPAREVQPGQLQFSCSFQF